MKLFSRAYLSAITLVTFASAACLNGGTESTINSALSAAGTNGVVQLCASSKFIINAVIQFAADGQELSTAGYPTGTTRATIIINATNSNQLTTMVGGFYRNNVKLLNLIIDGNRPAAWTIPANSGANIELGAGATGVTISYVASRNPRGWSCMHLAEGSTTWPYSCTKAKITNNDIGPCGTQDQWSDGISFSCTASTISNNTIVGSTDGAIVLFGAPGTTVSGNTITGSSTERGWGAINMVDIGPYSGNYSGVVVSNNKIIGKKMFNIGIAIGSSVWGGQSSPQYYLSGPAQKGLMVTGTTTTGTTKPNYLFADANIGYQGNDCTGYYSTWKVFNSNAALSYWSPGIQGSLTLGAGFTNSTTGSPYFYLCSYPAIAPNVTFAPGALSVTPDNARVAFLHRGIQLQYQSDNNLVAVNYSDPDAIGAVWASGHGGYPCGGSTKCLLIFQADSNLVNYVNGSAIWASGTNNGQTNKMVVLNQAPWIQVLGPSGVVLWDTTKLQ